MTKLVLAAFGNEACLYGRLLTANAANLFALERLSNNRIPGSFSTLPASTPISQSGELCRFRPRE
ncbi:uncharacterized protein K441DRAFT_659401 [Cenococcum geophilum 1.58]|uniref:uncharacterized protein n=1 Tax=Cenococcum geophilum 1.58 TaxID=794803 RepID=UPI00358E4B5A|nr:hypothetical protein K441DRAFT_659401 [Cenococcum geophilum 1.58]